jgi:hypothetical protein
MALSDQLTALAARAKQAEDHAAAAKQKAKNDVAHEDEVEAAQTSAAAHGEALREKASASKGKATTGCDNMQRSLNEHHAAFHKKFEDQKAVHDLKAAQRAADSAEEDAAWAIDYAYAAVDEADYAVLQAMLARMDADALATT